MSKNLMYHFSAGSGGMTLLMSAAGILRLSDTFFAQIFASILTWGCVFISSVCVMILLMNHAIANSMLSGLIPGEQKETQSFCLGVIFFWIFYLAMTSLSGAAL